MSEDLPVTTVADVAGVDRDHYALCSELARQGIYQAGHCDGGGVHRDLVRTCSKQCPAVRDRADTTTDGEGNEHLLSCTFHDVQHGGAIVRRGGDIEQH